MSLYNMLFGENKFAEILLAVIGASRVSVPRYRDVFVKGGEIVLHTRTGGGNRDFYESAHSRNRAYPGDDLEGPFNADLRALPGYLRDEDSEFDSTYANFYFSIPAEFAEIIAAMGDSDVPAERWKKLLADLESNKTSPAAVRALEVGEKVFEQLREAPSGTIIKI
jgi:hypothetical protein